MICGVVIGVASITACGGTIDPLAADRGAVVPERLELGQVQDFAPGITELDLPRRVFVVVDGDQISALDRKDPNNGCALTAVDDDVRASFDIANGNARFFDPCHGNIYDIAGRPLHCKEARSIRSIDVLVENGTVMWAGVTLQPAELEPLSRPDCPSGWN